MEYPASYKKLNYRNRTYIDCYLNETLVEPLLHKHTFCDSFVSYVFAYNKGKDVGECLKFNYYGTDAFGNTKKIKAYMEGCKVEIVVTNAAKYLSLNKCARSVHTACAKAINDIRTLMFDSDDKSKTLELKDAIYNSSLHAEDFKDRNENRKMMMKIFGLDQVKVDTSVDIYEASGKNILARVREEVKASNNGDEPIIPIDFEDIDIDEDKS